MKEHQAVVILGYSGNQANGEEAGNLEQTSAHFSQTAPEMCFYNSQAPAPQLPPRSRGLFTAGLIGAIIFAAILILYGAFDIFWEFGMYIYFPTIIWRIFSILLITGTILASVGTYGFTTFYKMTFGLVSFIFGIIASIIYILFIFTGELQLIRHALFGLMFILLGVSVFLVGKHTGKQGMCNVGGILLIVSGCFHLLLYLPDVGYRYSFLYLFEEFMMAVSGFVLAYIFLKAPAYSLCSQESINQPTFIHTTSQPFVQQPAQAGQSVEDRLRVLNKVYADGGISDEDYARNFQELQNQR